MGTKRKRPPVTLADVDAFLASPVARRWYAFSDSNVKRFTIRALWFLREEVERTAPAASAERPWTQRVRRG